MIRVRTPNLYYFNKTATRNCTLHKRKQSTRISENYEPTLDSMKVSQTNRLLRHLPDCARTVWPCHWGKVAGTVVSRGEHLEAEVQPLWPAQVSPQLGHLQQQENLLK